MFIGHIAVGLASKRFAPRTPLGLLIVAPLFADLLWPLFLLLGLEHVQIDPAAKWSKLDFLSYPWSHSLLALVVWATLFAGIYWVVTRYRPGAAVLWIGVVSHWFFDFIVHRADMPLWPGSPRYGLGLWNSTAGTMAVELAILAAGVWLYVRATRARDRIGRYAMIAYIALLAAAELSNPFSAPPPSLRSLICAGLIIEAVSILLPAWFDGHRVAQGATQPEPARVAG